MLQRQAQQSFVALLWWVVLASLNHSVGTTLHESFSSTTLENTLLELHKNLKDCTTIEYFDQNNVHRNLREVTLPVDRLGVNLEYVGNFFYKNASFEDAQRTLERACPLLYLLSHEDSLSCLQSLETVYRRTQFPPPVDADTIITQMKKLMNPFQHLKIELWLKNFIQSRRENTAETRKMIQQFLAQFTGHELLHRISIISQNLFSDLLMDDDDDTRLWAEGTLDVIHQHVWEAKMIQTPPLHFLHQKKDIIPSNSTKFLPESAHTNLMNSTSLSEEITILSTRIGQEINFLHPLDIAISTPNYIHELIYYQWTTSNPATFSAFTNVRPPSPSHTHPKNRQQHVLPSHTPHLDAATPAAVAGFDHLIPPLNSQPRSAVTTLQADGSALFALIVSLITLISITALLIHSNPNATSVIRRKPKRTPKKTFLEQLEDYITVFLIFLGSLSNIILNPIGVLRDSKLLSSFSGVSEQKKSNLLKANHHPTSTPSWTAFLFKLCNTMASSLWDSLSRLAENIFIHSSNYFSELQTQDPVRTTALLPPHSHSNIPPPTPPHLPLASTPHTPATPPPSTQLQTNLRTPTHINMIPGQTLSSASTSTSTPTTTIDENSIANAGSAHSHVAHPPSAAVPLIPSTPPAPSESTHPLTTPSRSHQPQAKSDITSPLQKQVITQLEIETSPQVLKSNQLSPLGDQKFTSNSISNSNISSVYEPPKFTQLPIRIQTKKERRNEKSKKNMDSSKDKSEALQQEPLYTTSSASTDDQENYPLEPVKDNTESLSSESRELILPANTDVHVNPDAHANPNAIHQEPEIPPTNNAEITPPPPPPPPEMFLSQEIILPLDILPQDLVIPVVPDPISFETISLPVSNDDDISENTFDDDDYAYDEDKINNDDEIVEVGNENDENDNNNNDNDSNNNNGNLTFPNEVSCFDDVEPISGFVVTPPDESIPEYDEFGPPPGFTESVISPKNSKPPSPVSFSFKRPSLLADLNQTSEVFLDSQDLSRVDAIGGASVCLSSRSRTVGLSHSPPISFFDTKNTNYGGNPFFSGDVDWTQPYLEPLDGNNRNSNGSKLIDFDESLAGENEVNYLDSISLASSSTSSPLSHSFPSNYPPPPPPSSYDQYSNHPKSYGPAYPPPPQVQSHLTEEEYYGSSPISSTSSSLSSSSASSYNHHSLPHSSYRDPAMAFPSISFGPPHLHQRPNRRHQPPQSDSNRRSQSHQSYPRSAVPNNWMIPSDHSRYPPLAPVSAKSSSWQHYPHHQPSMQSSPYSSAPQYSHYQPHYPQTYKLIFTVRARVLPPSKVAQVKIASSMFGNWSLQEALPMKSSQSTPGLWGLTVEIPNDIPRFSYFYFAIDVGGRVWVEPTPHRVIDFGILGLTSGDINQEDIFEHGRVQPVRDTSVYPKG